MLLIFNSEIPKSKFKELMSCVFVCQSRNYILDALILNNKKHDYLLQATTKTKGLYFPCVLPTRGTIQYFMQVFNISVDQRDNFKMPYLTNTPYNASCECHNHKVDLAWICSKCLGIYCKTGKEHCNGICVFCGVRFDLVDFNSSLEDKFYPK
jgi:transcription initiation factor TFIIH subunit 3